MSRSKSTSHSEGGRSKSTSPSEAKILASILRWLKKRGYMHWRQSSGRTLIGGRWIQFGPKGAPDIFVVAPGGKLCGIEVKTETGKLNPDQKRFLARLDEAGCHTCVARCLWDVGIFMWRVHNESDYGNSPVRYPSESVYSLPPGDTAGASKSAGVRRRGRGTAAG